MNKLKIRRLGIEEYLTTLTKMQSFVLHHTPYKSSEIWLVQHPSVYTQGTACDSQTLTHTNIPIVKSDRGGQMTYHGLGQIVMYVLLDIKHYGLTVKALVTLLEQCSILTLAEYGIAGKRREGAPGVYISEKKISALGLRFKRNISYHGLSLNVAMDLQPFSNIDPCGYEGLEVTQITDLLHDSDQVNLADVEQKLTNNFCSLIS